MPPHRPRRSAHPRGGACFVVLGRVSTSSHAVLNIVRRVTLIAVTAALFGTHVSAWNWVGVALTTAGVLAFGRSKQQAGGASRRRGAVLLPLSRDV